MMFLSSRWLGVVFILFLLGACSTLPRSAVPPSASAASNAWSDRVADMERVDSWDVKGKMAVRTADDGGSATFLWERNSQQHRIEMYGPFGGGRAIITQNGDGATMRDNKKNVYEDKNAELLLYRRVGWHVPFEAMNFWMKGVPGPGEFDALELAANGTALGFQQGGWEVSYLDYAERAGMLVPRKMFLKALPGTVHLVDEHGKDLGDRLEVKVVLRRWLPFQK